MFSARGGYKILPFLRRDFSRALLKNYVGTRHPEKELNLKTIIVQSWAMVSNIEINNAQFNNENYRFADHLTEEFI